MKNLLTIIFIALAANARSYGKLECIMENLYDKVKLSDDVRKHIAAKLNEQNMNNNYSDKSDEVVRQLIPIDFSSVHQVEKMLRNFKNQPDIFKQAVEACNLSMKETMELCKKKFKECETIDRFTVAKSCPANYIRFNYAYCVPQCDENVQPIDKDVFVCAKKMKSNRSEKIETADPNQNLTYRNSLKIIKCPTGFTDIHNDICIANCPYGWEDIGKKCLKPYFEQREYEFFSYAFQNEISQIKEHSY